MNTAEKYVYGVYKAGGFSKAAEKLFVSQPALSRAIKNHENRIGYEIFSRKNSPLTLTQEGIAYIEYLEELIQLEHRLAFNISTINTASSKTLCIGGYNSASHIVLPVLCKEFSRRFPDVCIKLNLGAGLTFSKLVASLEKGAMDILIATNFNSPKFKSEVLWREKYMIVIRKDYPGVEKMLKYSLSHNEVSTGNYPPEKEITDWDLFKNIRLFKPGKNKDAWKSFSEFFKKTPGENIKMFNFYRMDLHYKLMLEGLGGIVLPQSVIIDKGYDTNSLCCFSVSVPDNRRETMLVYKDDENSSPYVKEFIALTHEIYGGKGYQS